MMEEVRLVRICPAPDFTALMTAPMLPVLSAKK